MNKDLSSFYVSDAAISLDAIVDLSVKSDADTDPNKMVAVEGAAVDDNGNLIVPEAIKLASQEIAKDGLNTSYCPSVGMAELADLIYLETVGQDTADKLKQQDVLSSGLVCSGGTNALSVPLSACASNDDLIVVQNPHWSGYDSIALALGHKPLANFEFVNDEGEFNIDHFKETINNGLGTSSQRLIIILNTPFDNPLAKEIKKEAWRDITEYLKGLQGDRVKEITIILDTAYIDFGPGGKDYNRLSFLTDLFDAFDEHFNVVLATTLSKSFAMYGARIAASVLLSKDQDKVNLWKDRAGGIVRGMFSSASRLGQELAMNILRDPNKLENIHQYQADTVKLVQSRQDSLFSTLSKLDLFSDIKDGKNTPFRYIKPDGVFFTSLKLDDPGFVTKLQASLLENHVYVPIISNKYMRLPICGLRADFTEKLMNRLSEISENCLSYKV